MDVFDRPHERLGRARQLDVTVVLEGHHSVFPRTDYRRGFGGRDGYGHEVSSPGGQVYEAVGRILKRTIHIVYMIIIHSKTIIITIIEGKRIFL